MHPMLHEKLALGHHQDLLLQAKAEQRIKEARASQQAQWRVYVSIFGSKLVKFGRRLEQIDHVYHQGSSSHVWYNK